MSNLRNTPVGSTVTVRKIEGEGATRRRIMDMGITRGAEIFVRKVAPLGDPVEITVRGYELSLRKADAEMINGKRILILDDVISTGESLHAMEELVKRAGGIIAGKMAVLAEGDAKDRDDIITLAPLPLFNADGTVKA